MEELAEEYQGKVKVVGLNVDHAPDTAGTLGVMSIPVIIFFKDGNETGHAITMNSSNELIVVGGYDGRFVLSETQYSLPDCKFFIIKFDLNGDIIEFDN